MVKKLMASMLAFGISLGGIDGTRSDNFNYSIGLEKKIDESFLETRDFCYPNNYENNLLLEENLFYEEYKIKNVSEVDFTKIPTPKYISRERVGEIVDSLYGVMKVPKLISKDFFIASVQNESSFNIYAVGLLEERGLTQILPDTWREINPSLNFYLEAFNPELNLLTGLKVYIQVYNYVKKNNPGWKNLSEHEKLAQLITGYNWGIGNLERAANWNFEKVPRTTKRYFAHVIKSIS